MSKYPGKVISNLAPAGYSVFFDGTGDSITRAFTSTTDGMYPQGTTYTVEAWIYLGKTGSQVIYGVDAANVASFGYWSLSINSSTQPSLAVRASTGVSDAVIVTGNTLAVGQWYHIAFTASSGSARIFVNGAQVGSTGTVPAISFTPAGAAIGNGYNGFVNPFFQGYISNFRIVQGTALYTSAFTPPTQLLNITNTSLLTCNSPAVIDQSNNNFTLTTNGNAAASTFTPFTAYVPYNPALGASTPGIWTVDEAMQAAATRQWNMYDPSFPNTTLLLHGNPTNGTSFITDASTNNFTVTPNGDVRAANLSPFSLTTFATSGSGYFDGNGDYLDAPTNSAFGMGTGDFTLECWAYITAYPSLAGVLIDLRGGADPATRPCLEYSNTGTINYRVSGANRISGGTIPLNTWSHIAVCRASGTTRAYLNGVQVGSNYTDANDYGSSSRCRIGADDDGSLNVYVTGYVSNVRIVKGTAVYTGAFTTPTAPLTAVQAAGTNISAITGTQTALLTLQNSQSANNNAFLDSSSNNFLITRNGNTTQGSFSPFSQTGWSNYIGGSANFLNLTTATIGTNSFTIEAWVYLNSNSNFSGIFSLLSIASGTGVSLVFQNTGVLSGMVGNGGSALVISSPTAVAVSTWHHVAFVRSGTALTLYLNGVSVATGTSSANITQTSALIGRYYNDFNDYYLNGYISNLRVVNGAAVYTTNFTPPTAPLTAVTNTMLLTCQSNRFVDNSSNAYTISTSGTPSVQAFSPFYPTAAYTPQTIGGSAYFDGNADSLSSATNFEASTSTSTFTIEGWIYPTTFSTLINIIGGMVVLSGDQKSIAAEVNTSGQVALYWFDGSIKRCTGNTVMQLNAWNYFAIVVNSNAISIYVNKTTADTLSGTTTLTNRTQSTTLGVGAYYNNNTPAQYFTGYLSGLRYSTVARTISAVPTSPLLSDANVRWLLNFTNAGVVDSTGKNALETVGNAQISTAVSRFGGSSMYFDGTGDYLYGINQVNLQFLAGDYTIEFWVNPNSFTGTPVILDMRTVNAATGGAIQIYMTTGGVLTVVGGSSTGTTLITAGSAISTGAWVHVALTRSGTSTRLFINGTQSGSTATDSTSYGLGALWIGAIASGATNYFNGYLDDFRITKGIARYTGNFTPQTSQWQDQ